MLGASGSIVGWTTVLQAGGSRVRFWMSLYFPVDTNPFSRTMAMGSTQHVTEMSTRNLRRGKGRPADRQACGRSDRTSCAGHRTARMSHDRSAMSIGVLARPPEVTIVSVRALLDGERWNNFACTSQVICIISVNKVL
jgi:hypothetical protein